MATYRIRNEVETTHRTVIELPASTNWAEVEKALSACRQKAGDARADDAVQVEANEETIQFIVTHRKTVETAD